MASLSSPSSVDPHRNGTEKAVTENSGLTNEPKVVGDNFSEEIPPLVVKTDKTDLTVQKSNDELQMSAMSEATDITQEKAANLSGATAGQVSAEKEAESASAPETAMAGGKPQTEETASHEIVPPIAEADYKATADKVLDADDELAQIRKELASSGPTKADEEHPGNMESKEKQPSHGMKPDDQNMGDIGKVDGSDHVEIKAGKEHEEMSDSKDLDPKISLITNPENAKSTWAEVDTKKDADRSEKQMTESKNEPMEQMDNGQKIEEDPTKKENQSASEPDAEDGESKGETTVAEKKPAESAEEKCAASEENEATIDMKTQNDESSPVKVNAKTEEETITKHANETTEPSADAKTVPVNADVEMEEEPVAKNDHEGTEASADAEDTTKQGLGSEKRGENMEKAQGEEEDDEGEHVPLLEQPPETSGRRARKAVERFSESLPEAKKSTQTLEEGRGTKLADCPVVNNNIGSFAPEQVHTLHLVVFGRQGRSHEFRRNLRQFSGFSFRPDDAACAKKRDSMLRYRLEVLRSLSHLLNLDTKNITKEEMAQNILDFLLEPKPTDTVVESAKKRLPKTPRQGGRSSSRRSAAAASEQQEEEEEEEAESVTNKRTPSRRTPAKRTPGKKTPAKKTPAKRTPAKKTPSKKTPAKKTPAKKASVGVAASKTPTRKAPKRKRNEASPGGEEASTPASKRAKTGRAPPRARR